MLWETSILKDTTNEQKRSIDELCNVIKELLTRNRILEEQLIQQKKDELVKATKFETFIQTELRVLQKNTEILMTEIISIKNHLADHTVAKTEDTITSASKNDNTLKNWEFPLKPVAERSTQNKTGKFHWKRTSDSNAIILDNDIDNEIRNMISQNNLTTLTSVSSSINATSLLPKEDKSTNFKTDDVPKQKKNRQPKATVKDNDINQNGINTAGEENFQIVEKKKRKRNKISVGENMDESDFVGAKRKIWLFLSRVRDDVTEETVRNYISKQLKEEGPTVDVKQVSPYHKTKCNNCFIIGVPLQHKSTVYGEKFWPNGICFSRFDFHRGQHFLGKTQNHDQS